jgi:hypothetical protein
MVEGYERVFDEVQDIVLGTLKVSVSETIAAAHAPDDGESMSLTAFHVTLLAGSPMLHTTPMNF